MFLGTCQLDSFNLKDSNIPILIENFKENKNDSIAQDILLEALNEVISQIESQSLIVSQPADQSPEIPKDPGQITTDIPNLVEEDLPGEPSPTTSVDTGSKLKSNKSSQKDSSNTDGCCVIS
jgi:hypothetical protein